MRTPIKVAVGDRPEPRSIGPLTATDIVRFAGAGGDFNPLHHDPAFAASAGYPSVIAMGQLQAGMLAGWLTDWCGVEHLVELEVRFVAPVRPGDALVFRGEVTEITDSVARLNLDVSAGERQVVRGHAQVRVA